VSSRDRLARMDVDTGWAYHHKVRDLQRRYPERWPVYWAAYLALLGEAWATGDRRLTIADTYPPPMPAPLEETLEALKLTRIVDRFGRVPLNSWREWYGPVAARMAQKSSAGALGAAARWGPKAGANGAANAGAMHHPSQPSLPAKPSPRPRARGRKPRGADEEPTPEQAREVWEGLRQQFGTPPKPDGDPV
jgi:hypothetical protein